MPTRTLAKDSAGNQISTVKHPGTGFVLVSGRLTRPGILRYQGTDGRWLNAVRLLEDVTHPDYVTSTHGSAVMVDHPQSPRVTVGDSLDGLIYSATADEAGINIEAWLTSKDAILAIDSGVRQLSACYDTDWVLMSEPEVSQARALFPRDAAACTDGIWCYHKNMIMNHGAIVPSGRAGSGCALDDVHQLIDIEEIFMTTNAKALAADAAPMMDMSTGMSASPGSMGTGGAVSMMSPAGQAEAPETPEEEAEEDAELNSTASLIAAAAMAIAAAATSLVEDSARHGIVLTTDMVIGTPEAAAAAVLKHFVPQGLPMALDSAELRLPIAQLFAAQKPAAAAAEVDHSEAIRAAAREIAADSAALIAVTPTAAKQALSLVEQMARISKAANKV